MGARPSDRLFEVTLKVLTQNVRGVLRQRRQRHRRPRTATSANISTEERAGTYASLFITVQVAHRLHLAKVIREVRNIPEVVRINRREADQRRPDAVESPPIQQPSQETSHGNV